MKNSIYDVSVIIPTYNRSELLGYTLHSLLTQTISKKRYEVIICDDGSSDDTREMVSKYENLMNVKYVFQVDKGYRPASARNNGIRIAEGKVCLFIDSSVILHSNCLAEHTRFHTKKKSPSAAIGYVYGFANYDDESQNRLRELISVSDPDESIKRILDHGEYLDAREPHYEKYNNKIHDLPAPWFYFWTCHLSVATKDLFRIGFFDEAYDGRWGVEDCDLGFRLHNNGVKICVLRTAFSIHYPHEKPTPARQTEGYFNSKYFHEKFGTTETKLFLDSYMAPEMLDINAPAILTHQLCDR